MIEAKCYEKMHRARRNTPHQGKRNRETVGNEEDIRGRQTETTITDN